MARLAETLERARRQFDAVDGDPDELDRLIGILEDAGSQLGTLQVTCCAPARMPLYARMLEDLTKIQRAAKSAAGEGH